MGKDLDRLLKGRFFQALLPVWQRKVRALKPDESFSELFNHARTMERREQQYSEAAVGRNVSPSNVEGQSQKPSQQNQAGA